MDAAPPEVPAQRTRLAAARERWQRLDRPQRIALAGLALLLVAGAALRLVAMLAYRPGFIGYPDTAVYVTGAKEALFADKFRVVGYSAFLRAVHDVNANLSFTTLVQHAIGLGTGVLVYATVRRAGGPPWLGLPAAAVVLLGGDQVLFEHAILSESVYTFLVVAGLYFAVRTIDGSPIGWPAAAGLALGLAATVRLAGVALVPLAVLWMLVVPAARWRDRLARSGVAALAGGAVLLGYLYAAEAETGKFAFTRTGAYNFYGRVATFADCNEFQPPAGSDFLCEDVPPHERRPALFYAFAGPAPGAFGEPQIGDPTPGNLKKLSTWSRRAALAQPLDWADAAARDFARYVSPNSFTRPNDTPTARDYRHVLVDSEWVPKLVPLVDGYYDTGGIFVRQGLFDALRDYENVTAVEGPPMGILLVLAAAGPFLLRGRERRAALLLSVSAYTMLAVPVITLAYDGRLGVPAYGPLAAAAVLGGLGIGRIVAPRVRSSRA